MTTYRSEVQIPIKQDHLDFRDRQVQSWDNVQSRMDHRQQGWDKEFDKLRGEFYALKPLGTTGGPITKLDDMKSMYGVNEKGDDVFRARFDVKEFKPDQIQVNVNDRKLMVQARSEEKIGSSTVSKQYSRQVDIPGDVDADAIECNLSRDGILTIEAAMKKGHSGLSPVKPGNILQQQDAGAVRSPDLSFTSPMSASNRCPIVTDKDGNRKLELFVDMAEFRPDQIVVKTLDRVVMVSASHEYTDGGRKMTKSFSKEYELPDDVDPLAVSAYMQENGKLVIEAPLKTSATRPVYAVSQTHDTRRVVTTRQSTVKSGAGNTKPMITISVSRR